MARVFPFILKAKHKTLHVKWAWAELEILQKKKKKKSSRASIDRALQIYTINLAVRLIPTLHINTL